MSVNQFVGNADDLVISETKVYVSFFIGEFRILGFSTSFKRNTEHHGGGFLVFLKKDIPDKHFSSESIPFKGIYIKLSQLSQEKLVVGLHLKFEQKCYNEPFRHARINFRSILYKIR